MNDELASVKGIVVLSAQEALGSAQAFLVQQGYRVVRREEHSLTVERRLQNQAEGQEAPMLTVTADPQPEGGVRVTVRGNDREGVQERQAAWVEWSESLPKQPEVPVDEPGYQQQTIETPEVPLPPPPRVDSSDVPQPSQSPGRRSSRLLVGALVGCGTLSILGMLLTGALVVGASVGMQKAKEQGESGGNEGETTNTPKTESGEEYIPVVLRVSGEQGSQYRCSHKDMSDEGDVIFEQEEGVLGSSPVEYRSRILDTGISDPYSNYTAECVLPDPRNVGRIKAEVLVNDQVVVSEETRPDPPGQESPKSNRLTVTWGPYAPKEGESSKGKKK